MEDKNNEEIEGYTCTDCGADVSEEDKICPKCGADLTVFEEENTEKDAYSIYNLELESFQYIQDPSSLTKFLKVMLVVYFTISFISLVPDIMQLELLNSFSFSQTQA
ncbi:MAG: zinc ribbon domain-containing protein, partial [Ignavibacteria bacterium]|nr:zinc ribbon domain-containing protein [Ignavibacteria bacterium]